MQVIWQWAGKLWSKLSSSTGQEGSKDFFTTVKDLPAILKFVVLIAVLEIAVVGFLAYERELGAQLLTVLLWLGISLFVLALIGIVAYMLHEWRTTSNSAPIIPRAPAPPSVDPNVRAILQFISDHNVVTREEIRQGLQLPMETVETVCNRLLAEDLARQADGLLVVSPGTARYLR